MNEIFFTQLIVWQDYFPQLPKMHVTFVEKSLKKLLTQALYRHNIEVVPEHKNCTGAQNKQSAKTPQKQPLLAGGCFIAKPLIEKDPLL